MTKADERITRIEAAIERLEALGLTGPSPSPTAVNPDGTPGLVAPGELIESAWGNAVANEVTRKKSWGITSVLGAGPFGGTRTDYPGLAVTVTFNPARLYKITAYVPEVSMNSQGLSLVYITSSNTNTILNQSTDSHYLGEPLGVMVSTLTSTRSGTDTMKVQMASGGGSSTVSSAAGATKQAFLLVEEISMS